MLFQNDEASLNIEVVNYEFASGGAGGDDLCWLVLRGTYREDDLLVRDTNSCLLTYELRDLAAGLKVVRAGIRERYESDFAEPYFALSAQAEGESFRVYVAFTMPNTMEDLDTAEVFCTMSQEQLSALIDELDGLCAKFPDRT